MPGYVSVPEKTLEHWSSQYINSRFRTHAALWWPARGQDIDVRWLPSRPGKAVQLELKTTTVTGPRSHEVLVDLGQLEEYRQKPQGYQPFYVFPWPDWYRKLEDDAAAWGPPVTELAFSRSGRGWWFSHWMVAMTTRQVAEILDADLKQHGSTARKTKKPLVQFEVTISADGKTRKTKATWGPGKRVITPDPVIAWTDLWTELAQCGREGWPQLIRLPMWMVRAGGPYSREQLVSLLEQGKVSLSDVHWGRDVPFATLEPDDDGNFVARADADVLEEAQGDEPEGTVPDAADEGVEDNRTVVFLDSSELAPKG
jgi:hypothetical protein